VAVSNVNRDTNYHDVVLRTAQNVKWNVGIKYLILIRP
jgi:hypothetical protein